jgi:hypothetical protein
MDQDLKKSLKDMADAIAALTHHTKEPAAGKNQGGQFESRVGILEERSDWHRIIGGSAIGLAVTAVGILLTWWIPHEIQMSGDSLQASIKSDTQSQLLPIQTELARIDALMTLRQTGSVASAIKQTDSVQRPQAKIEAVKAIVQEAKSQKIITPSAVLIDANHQIKAAVAEEPTLTLPGWEAQLALINYRSSLPPKTEAPATPPENKLNLPVFTNVAATNGGQKLDGVYWKNSVFINVRVEYDGGPMILDNVRFINCVFVMKYTPPAEQFADLILNQNLVTGILS